MASDIRIALDAMGGDSGPSVVVPGAAIALERRPDLRFLVFGDETRGDAASCRTSQARRAVARLSRQRRGQDDRQAEPGPADGAAGVVDVAGDRGGQGRPRRLRRVGRQHRRPHGDGEVLPAHHGADRSPRDRGALADAARRIDRPRRRRDDRRRRAPSRRFGGDGRGDGAHRVRYRQPDDRPPQHRGRGDQGRRGGQGGGAHPARGQLPPHALSRLRRGRRSRQGRGRRLRHRGIHRQHRAENRRGHGSAARPIRARRDEPQLHVARRLLLRPQGACGAAGANEPPRERRRLSRT